MSSRRQLEKERAWHVERINEIKKYWAERVVSVPKVWLEERSTPYGIAFVICSNMVNGKPQTKGNK